MVPLAVIPRSDTEQLLFQQAINEDTKLASYVTTEDECASQTGSPWQICPWQLQLTHKKELDGIKLEPEKVRAFIKQIKPTVEDMVAKQHQHWQKRKTRS